MGATVTEQQQPDESARNKDSLLVRYLSDHDEACPRCGYNLRMLTGHRCPECGGRLRLRVGLVEARLGAYINALVAGCLGFGGASFFMVLVLCYAPPEYWRRSASPWLMMAQAVVMGLILGVLLLKRRGFTKQTHPTQVLYAVLIWLLTVGLSGLTLVFFED